MATIIPWTGQTSPLYGLPTELLQNIADYLNAKDHSALARTCRRLTFDLQDWLFSRYSAPGDYYPVTYGIRRNDVAIVKRALAYRQPPCLTLAVHDRVTALGLAAGLGHASVVSYLLQEKSGASHVGQDGRSPLTHALDGLQAATNASPWYKFQEIDGYVNTILELLDHGANPTIDMSSEKGDDWAAPSYPIIHILDLLSIHSLWPNHAICLMKGLLQCGAGPNTLAPDGCTPLHTLIALSNPAWFPVIRLLLDHGADPNFPSQDGRTPLGWAICKADWEQLGPGGGRPLHLDVIDALLAHGADPDADAEPGHAPLGLAVDACADAAAVAEALIQAGADPDPRGHLEQRVTPLMRAVARRSADRAEHTRVFADFCRLRALFGRECPRRPGFWPGGAREDEAVPLTMTAAEAEGWYSTAIPVLLRAGARVSMMDLRSAEAKLEFFRAYGVLYHNAEFWNGQNLGGASSGWIYRGGGNDDSGSLYWS